MMTLRRIILRIVISSIIAAVGASVWYHSSPNPAQAASFELVVTHGLDRGAVTGGNVNGIAIAETTGTGTTMEWQTTVKRTGAGAYRFVGGNVTSGEVDLASAPQSTVILTSGTGFQGWQGAAFRFASFPTSSTPVWMMVFVPTDGSTVGADNKPTVKMRNDGRLLLSHSNTTEGTVATDPLSLNKWYYLLLHGLNDAATEPAAAQDQELFIYDGDTGQLVEQLTYNTAVNGAFLQAIGKWGGGSSLDYSGAEYFIDDIIFVRGDTNPGPVKIFPKIPTATSSAGTFTAVGAATQHEAVTEVPPDDDTSYVLNGTGLTNDQIEFTLSSANLGSADVVHATRSMGIEKHTGSSPSIQLGVKVGTSESLSAITSTTGYNTRGVFHTLNPDTGTSWTPSTVDTARGVLKDADLLNRPFRFTNAWWDVIYQQVYVPTISVGLSATPASGNAPLNGVDLTATVSGTATGDIRYRFDCTNDATYEVDITTPSNPYTATDACDYASANTYTARVRVDREGVFAEDTETITVNPTPTVSVTLSANPSSGTEPLNDVDLSADVSGTATGDIQYRFDCTNDGSYEVDVTNSSDPYTAVDACDFASPNTYTARVRVDREGVFAEDTETITVNPAPSGCTPSTDLTAYNYQFVRQNSYPTLDWLQSYQFEVVVKNTGSATWCQGTVNLGTDRPRDRVPGFVREDLEDHNPSGWISPNRVQLVESSVAPNTEGTFRFWMTPLSGKAPDTYREYFRVVADGLTWMEDYGIYWDVKIPTIEDSYHALFVSQNGYPTMQRGQSYQFEVRLKNTGVKSWAQGIVNLGTDRARDRIPGFIREGGNPSGWISPNRVELVESSVAPEATGTFRFWLTVPSDKATGTHREYFRPVADGITWMDDWGIYWDVTVVP